MVNTLATEKTAMNANDATPQKILLILASRFGAIPSELVKKMQALDDQRKLEALVWQACNCPDVDSFHRQLAS
jgi:hypothetical protein